MTEENNLNLPRLALAFIDQKTRDHSRTGIGGKGSGESQVRGLIDRRKIRGGPPMGTRFPPPAPSLDRARLLGDKTIDIDKHPRQTSVVFDMPNKNPEKARKLKPEWYLRNKEEILKRKRERRAALWKPKPPRPPKPAPTPEQKAKAREANRLACNRYRATHLAQVRHLNRDYYRRNRERIVQQQRDRRSGVRQNKQSPFRQLRALADVCAARLLELEHGYARIEPTPKKAGPREK